MNTFVDTMDDIDVMEAQDDLTPEQRSRAMRAIKYSGTSIEVKLRKELFNLRFQHVTGQLDNPLKMKEIKRDIARIKTVIRENELKAAEK